MAVLQVVSDALAAVAAVCRCAGLRMTVAFAHVALRRLRLASRRTLALMMASFI